MLIKTVKASERVPIFYAPFTMDYSRNYEAKCTLLGLNVVFYLIVEFRYALLGMFRICSAKLHNKKIIK